MKIKKLSIQKSLDLLSLIRGLGIASEDGKGPRFKMPIRFSWACSRTCDKLVDALKPIQPRIDEIWNDWRDKVLPDYNEKIEKATGKKKQELERAKQDAIKGQNEKWREFSKEEIEVEIFEFPKFRENEVAQLDECGFTPDDLTLFIEVMDLNLCDDVAV